MSTLCKATTQGSEINWSIPALSIFLSGYRRDLRVFEVVAQESLIHSLTLRKGKKIRLSPELHLRSSLGCETATLRRLQQAPTSYLTLGFLVFEIDRMVRKSTSRSVWL